MKNTLWTDSPAQQQALTAFGPRDCTSAQRCFYMPFALIILATCSEVAEPHCPDGTEPPCQPLRVGVVCDDTAGEPDLNQNSIDCSPDCAGKQCGDDGCGHECAECPAGKHCSHSQCVLDYCDPCFLPEGTPDGQCRMAKKCSSDKDCNPNGGSSYSCLSGECSLQDSPWDHCVVDEDCYQECIVLMEAPQLDCDDWEHECTAHPCSDFPRLCVHRRKCSSKADCPPPGLDYSYVCEDNLCKTLKYKPCDDDSDCEDRCQQLLSASPEYCENFIHKCIAPVCPDWSNTCSMVVKCSLDDDCPSPGPGYQYECLGGGCEFMSLLAEPCKSDLDCKQKCETLYESEYFSFECDDYIHECSGR